MKHMTRVTIPEKQVDEVDHVTCDLCGMKIEAERFEVAEATVQIRRGSAYPEGGSETTRSVDVCCDCFEQKLIPWLESQGAVIQENESEW
jgi:hypothetical protein